MSAIARRMQAERELALNAARIRGTFTYGEIAADLEIAHDRAAGLVRRLVDEGLAVFDHVREGGRRVYRVCLTGSAATPPDPDDRPPPLSVNPTLNLWRSMRGLRVFTPRDLAAHSTTDTCTVSERQAQAYCQTLVRADYLRVERKAIPGRQQAVYRLIRNTGPTPPEERRVRAIWDQNLRRIVHVDGAEVKA